VDDVVACDKDFGANMFEVVFAAAGLILPKMFAPDVVLPVGLDENELDGGGPAGVVVGVWKVFPVFVGVDG